MEIVTQNQNTVRPLGTFKAWLNFKFSINDRRGNKHLTWENLFLTKPLPFLFLLLLTGAKPGCQQKALTAASRPQGRGRRRWARTRTLPKASPEHPKQ